MRSSLIKSPPCLKQGGLLSDNSILFFYNIFKKYIQHETDTAINIKIIWNTCFVSILSTSTIALIK